MEISFPDTSPAVKQPPGTFGFSEWQRGISEFNLDCLWKLWELLHAKPSPENVPDISFIPIRVPFCKQTLLAPLLFSVSELATVLITAGECSIYKMNYFADVQNPSQMPNFFACLFFQLPYCSALFLKSLRSRQGKRLSRYFWQTSREAA